MFSRILLSLLWFSKWQRRRIVHRRKRKRRVSKKRKDILSKEQQSSSTGPFTCVQWDQPHIYLIPWQSSLHSLHIFLQTVYFFPKQQWCCRQLVLPEHQQTLFFSLQPRQRRKRHVNVLRLVEKHLQQQPEVHFVRWLWWRHLLLQL